MTYNTMREAFEKWATDKGYSIERWIYGDHMYANRGTQEDWEVWQAAQSVAVVGEPVAWVRKDKLQHVNTFGPVLCDVYDTEQPGTVALIEKPTHSIPAAAELDALRSAAKEREAVRDEMREWLVSGLDEITGLCRYLRQGGCDSTDLLGLEEGLTHAIDVASEMLSVLAAAPAMKEEK